jgi:hypothetical protein
MKIVIDNENETLIFPAFHLDFKLMFGELNFTLTDILGLKKTARHSLQINP